MYLPCKLLEVKKQVKNLVMIGLIWEFNFLPLKSFNFQFYSNLSFKFVIIRLTKLNLIWCKFYLDLSVQFEVPQKLLKNKKIKTFLVAVGNPWNPFYTHTTHLPFQCHLVIINIESLHKPWKPFLCCREKR